jgi:hypothetical protein
MINVRPKLAIRPYMPSAVAAPKPIAKPDNLPLSMVLEMHSSDMGPIAIAIEKPIRNPLNRNVTIIIIRV